MERKNISGTAPIADDGTTAHVGDPYRQASRCLELINEAIEKAGGTIHDIVRTRMFLTDLSIVEDVTRAHTEYFAQVRPASTLVVIDKLIRSDMMVEIEADGIILEKFEE